MNFRVISSPFFLSAVLRVHLETDATPLDEELLRSIYVANELMPWILNCSDELKRGNIIYYHSQRELEYGNETIPTKRNFNGLRSIMVDLPSTIAILPYHSTAVEKKRKWDDSLIEEKLEILNKIRQTPEDCFATCVYMKAPSSEQRPQLLCSKSRLISLKDQRYRDLNY
uniref:Uncharacterized protein n=1 Tax=Heterorhabditis bacteriophora TaxID=37862 RepID=A0A1I7X9W1_HETBA